MGIWAEAGKGLVGFAVASVADGLLKKNPNKEITDRLDKLAGQVGQVLGLLQQIPELVAKVIEAQFERERHALLVSYVEQTKVVLKGVGRVPTQQQVDSLQDLLLEIRTATDAVWIYGPFVYPLAAQGMLTAFTINRTIATNKVEVRAWAELQKRNFTAALSVLPKLEHAAERLREDHMREIDVLPRDLRNVGGGEVIRFVPHQGLPPRGSDFTLEVYQDRNDLVNTSAWYPGIGPGSDKWGGKVLEDINFQLHRVRWAEDRRDMIRAATIDIELICAAIDDIAARY